MAIRKQVVFLNGKLYGGFDLGTGGENIIDNVQEAARNTLVFLATCINGNRKIPLGYFLIHSLTGTERANLLTKCLELFAETGAKCYSITFDGASSNMSMCKIMGANFGYYSENFKPWFNFSPTSELPKKPVYILWGACHMLKLVRNTLGDKKYSLFVMANILNGIT